MNSRCFVGFDTSNYTTSVSLASESGEILANIRVPLPVGEGERGLRQSDALFSHIRNLPEACRALKEALESRSVAAVGCSTRPRRAENSYMPCFRAGVAAAEAFAAGVGVRVLPFSHQEGHVMAALFSSGTMETLPAGEFAAFHVSGGTTEMLLVHPEKAGFTATILGGSADLHAGQAIDRVGVMMGLRFPCGKEIERLAKENTLPVPSPRVCVEKGQCHFSGLENLAQKLWAETGNAPLVSDFVLRFTAKTLVGMTAYLDQTHPGLPVVYSGGVMSNQYLQSVLSARKDTYFAAPEFSADNAAGIALLCRRQVLAEEKEGTVFAEC